MLSFVINILEKILLKLKDVEKGSTENISVNVTENKSLTKSKILLWIVYIIPTLLIFLGASFAISAEENLSFGYEIISYVTIFLVFISMFISLLYNFTKKYVFLIHFPLLVSFLFIVITLLGGDSIFEGNIFTILIGVYPLVFVVNNLFEKYLNNTKLKNSLDILGSLSFNYNLAYFFLLSLNTTLLIFGFNVLFFNGISESIKEILISADYSSYGGLLEYILSSLVILFFSFTILLYPVYTLHIYFNKDKNIKKRNVNYGILSILLVIVLTAIWNLRGEVYSEIINEAKNNFSQEGYNKEAYDDINKFLLKHAFLYKIENNKYIDQDLFKKVFDATPVGLFGEKISKYSSNRNSFATNISKIGDKADVVFSLAEIKNHFVKSENGDGKYFLETTYDFYFENQTNTNQEVIINFESPSKYSVITDLFLGLNSELIGQIAPRGAARKVYDNSLRRNTDPALLEKVGLNTYNLRIFPIPSKKVNQGKQKVVVKMVSPVLNENIILTPKYSIINLKFNNNSRLTSKVYKDGELQKESIFKTPKDIQEFISRDQNITLSQIGLPNDYEFGSMCTVWDLENKLRYSDIDNDKKLGNKIHIFFDNSMSIKRSNTHKLYNDLYKEIKNYGGKLQDVESYSHNFIVNKVSEVSDIEFWGYSNIDGFVEYLIDNNIKNQRIIYVTDDESFEFNSDQNTNYYSSDVGSNSISVIKIGNKIKSYKSEFNTLLSKTQGNIYQVNKKSDISQVLSKILGNKQESLLEKCDNFYGRLSDNHTSIQAGIVSSMVLSAMNGNNSHIPSLQTQIAEKYHIVNQFNSLIALETQRQQNELDRFSEQSDRFDVKYDTGDNFKGAVNFGSVNRGGFNIQSSSLTDSIGDNGSSGDMLFGSSKITTMGNSGRYSSYNRSIDINLVGFLLILIYITQVILFISFIIDYKKRK